MLTTLPYCGAPPNPGELWTRWRLDPIVITVLVALWLAYFVVCRREASRGDRGSSTKFSNSKFWMATAGWLIVAFALISPLCPLSVSLFSARATQHVAITLIGAPLIAAALPWHVFAGARRTPDWRAPDWIVQPAVPTTLFAICMWVWHMPVPYAATFASVAVYWSMHVSMFVSALWLWAVLLASPRRSMVSGLFAGVASAIQMGLLGALITLSPRPFYVPHFLTTEAWGLSPLQDQQFGGAIMWVVGCTAFFAAALLGFLPALMERNSTGIVGHAQVRR